MCKKIGVMVFKDDEAEVGRATGIDGPGEVEMGVCTPVGGELGGAMSDESTLSIDVLAREGILVICILSNNEGPDGRVMRSASIDRLIGICGGLAPCGAAEIRALSGCDSSGSACCEGESGDCDVSPISRPQVNTGDRTG